MSGLSDAVERRNWNGGSYSSWGGASTVTLPHGANEYFTALSLSYAGDYNTGHHMKAIAAALPAAVSSASSQSRAPMAILMPARCERSALKYSASTAIGTIQLPKLTRMKGAPV